MSAATLTSKGQITLPKSVRERLKVGEGDRVEFVETETGFLIRAARRDIREIKGILPRPQREVTIETMNNALARMGSRKP